ncbi:rab-GTPase-TBC domain-containing protein [Cladochytrium replicatum]|nr:rab-GTPase-TBC domain-containing protein [Cladochytrium replicatum]
MSAAAHEGNHKTQSDSSNQHVKKSWRVHSSSLPGRVRIVFSGADQSASHEGIGLGAGIFGGRLFGTALDPPAASRNISPAAGLQQQQRPHKSSKNYSKKFAKFLEETDSDWDASTSSALEKAILASGGSGEKTIRSISVLQQRSPVTLSNSPARSVGSSSSGVGGGLVTTQPETTSVALSSTEKDALDPTEEDTMNPRKSLDAVNASKKAEEESRMLGEIAKLNTLSIRFQKFKLLLEQPNIDLEQVRKLSWSGIPDEIRPTVWKLLMGYLPCNSDRRDATLTRKRKEYEEYVAQSFPKGKATDEALYHQIHIDVKRTNASIQLYTHPAIREALERVLYCWAIRHPASGYVQGINDLVVPFFHVFLAASVVGKVENTNVDAIPKEVMGNVEADCFWCLTKLLDGIQDNYTFAQPGIQRQISRLKELINRIDAPLFNHLQAQGVDFIQFAFRWMNCLLMREISLKNTIRMWDTYQAETDGFSDFHLYVCAAFLVKWSDKLKKMEFQDIMMFLQSVPTSTWEEKDIEILLAEAFMWKELFHNSPSHLAGSTTNGGS